MVQEKTMQELEHEMNIIPGTLIVLEAIDGGGKDTQADLMVERLGYVKCRLPFYENDTGKLIDKHRKEKKKNCSEEFFQALMLANYLEYFDAVIKPVLDQGKNVVMTRYTPSMVAYASSFGANDIVIQAYKIAIEEHIDSRYTVKNILLKIPLDKSIKRIDARDKNSSQKKDELFENEKTLLHVSSIYNDEDNNLFNYIIDGDQTIERVYSDLTLTLGEL